MLGDQVQLLFDDPAKAEKQQWIHDPRVFDEFLLQCLPIVDSTPATARSHVQTALKYAPTRCQRVVAWGLWAEIHRSLNQSEEAEDAIRQARRIGDGCESCLAEISRHSAAVRKLNGNFLGALEEATDAIQRHKDLDGPGHSLHGNGIASSYNARAAIRFYMEDYGEAAADFREALAILDPRISSGLHRVVLTNLASSLLYGGEDSDLPEAEKCLEKARRLFMGVQQCSQERAKLDWVTAQVRYRLSKGKPSRMVGMMERSLADFLTLGFHLEAVAVGSDLMKMKTARPWGRDSYRPVIERTLQTLSQGLPKIPNELCKALDRVASSSQAHHMNSHMMLKNAIDDLREACGPKMIPCLLSW